MDRTELREGLKLFRDLIEGCERINSDPEAIARMQRRAIEHPEITLGETLADLDGENSEIPFFPLEGAGE